MVIFSTDKENTEKNWKKIVCTKMMSEKKLLRRRICLKKMFAGENFSYPPPEK